MSADNQKAFYITDTILHKIDMLKVKPKGGHFDWSIFNNLPDQKKTFIYSDNSLIRFCVFKGVFMLSLDEGDSIQGKQKQRL